MTIAAAIALVLGALLFTLFVRKQDLPEPIPVSPLQHLEERKSAIYDNLRDLQFEYRLGKLSDPDYQATKLSLQKELSVVLAEMESTAAKLGLSTKRVPAKRGAKAQAQPPVAAGTVCPSCNARFEKPLKFCGECGKAMA
jgi:rRNA maturation endonuclease Nob1